jgi:hypothetical protein
MTLHVYADMLNRRAQLFETLYMTASAQVETALREI